MRCPICNGNSLKKIYKGKVRDGNFGKITNDKYEVYKCQHCDIKFLYPFPKDISLFYETKKYREKYNNGIDAGAFQKAYDDDQLDKLQRIGLHNLRHKIVADYGAGAGSFLDAVAGLAATTIAIEPASIYHDVLSKKHHCFSYGKDLLAAKKKIDIATSFNVIEHVINPKKYIAEIYKSLKPGGSLYLMTPNYDEILNKFIKKYFDPFNYRTAHLYYFNEKSLKYLMKACGFVSFKISFNHRYGISNLLSWLKYHQPMGNNKYKLFDKDFDNYYAKYLEKIKRSSHIWLEAKK